MVIIISNMSEPKWNNLPITHWTYTTINVIKTDLKFESSEYARFFSVQMCVNLYCCQVRH